MKGNFNAALWSSYHFQQIYRTANSFYRYNRFLYDKNSVLLYKILYIISTITLDIYHELICSIYLCTIHYDFVEINCIFLFDWNYFCFLSPRVNHKIRERKKKMAKMIYMHACMVSELISFHGFLISQVFSVLLYMLPLSLISKMESRVLYLWIF